MKNLIEKRNLFPAGSAFNALVRAFFAAHIFYFFITEIVSNREAVFARNPVLIHIADIAAVVIADRDMVCEVCNIVHGGFEGPVLPVFLHRNI